MKVLSSRHQKNSGFTLIEVLVVTAIIGILAAISMQTLTSLKRKSFDSRALQDLRNLASAEEAYFASSETFKSCGSTTACQTALPGISAFSPGVTLAITSTPTGFTGSATHPRGTGIIYQWNSSAGGLQ